MEDIWYIVTSVKLNVDAKVSGLFIDHYEPRTIDVQTNKQTFVLPIVCCSVDPWLNVKDSFSHFEAPSKPKLRFTLGRGAQVYSTPTNINHRHSRRFFFVCCTYIPSFFLYLHRSVLRSLQMFYLTSSSWFDKSSTAQFSELEVHFWTSELSVQRSYHYTRILSTKYKYLVEAYGEDASGGVVGQGQVHGAPQLLGLTAGARRRRLQQTSWWRRCFRKIVRDCEESGREKKR